jgi:thioredoxin 1
MPTVDLDSSNFVSNVSRDGIVLVEFWAPWCGACRAFTPIFERVADKHPEHTFGKLDTEGSADIASKLGLQHVPALALYRDGILLFLESGSFEEARLEDILSQAEGLDMNAVRAEIEANRKAGEAGNENAEAAAATDPVTDGSDVSNRRP